MDRLGLPYDVFPVNADETIPADESPDDAATVIALRKLDVGLLRNARGAASWGIAADTLVEGPAGLLGKPAGAEEAVVMISALSGRTHAVHTSVAVHAPGGEIRSVRHTTKVTFRMLSAREVDAYVRTGEWQGAAGGYRIQGVGAVLVERIDGLWSTVVGLPLGPLFGILSGMSYPLG